MDGVFRIPELVRLICGFGEAADNAHLALTCRSLFTRAIPLAWAHVSGVSQLLVPIEGVICEEIPEERVLGGVKVKLPDNLEGTSQSRFHLYAPFVTSLEIYKHQYQKLLVPRLESFAQRCTSLAWILTAFHPSPMLWHLVSQIPSINIVQRFKN
ncbi:hypothetical protein RSAG8_12804, partial [Rhizoctonia solani AG-8 WAC10335]